MSCPKCGSKNRRQIPPEELCDGSNPEGEEKFGFISIVECLDCGYREYDD